MRQTLSLKWAFAAAVVGVVGYTGTANAGFPECGNIRLEDVKRCEIRGTVKCTAGCSELGVYKTACATKLQTVCGTSCTLPAQPTCSDACTQKCTSDCDVGINVICIHNCFKECVGSCDVKCAGVANVAQCRATCEANCDGECDIKCKPLVSGSCYQHCIECCGGSCKAQANLDCQTTCQDKTFEQCERELRINCDASCSADGAIFCDGKYVISGSDIPTCAKAIVDRGISANFNAQGTVTVGGSGTFVCSVAPKGDPRSKRWNTQDAFLLLAVFAVLRLRQR